MNEIWLGINILSDFYNGRKKTTPSQVASLYSPQHPLRYSASEYTASQEHGRQDGLIG